MCTFQCRNADLCHHRILFHLRKKKLACTICILISCIGHRQHLNVGNFQWCFDFWGLKSEPVGLIIYGSLFIWQVKLFKITKREKLISSQMFYFAFFLWFSANIVTHVIFKFYLNSMRYMCIIIWNDNLKICHVMERIMYLKDWYLPALCSVVEQSHFK